MVRVKIVKVRYNVKVSYVLQQLAWSRPDWFWILGQPRPLNTTCAYNVTAYLCICQLKFKTTGPVDYTCLTQMFTLLLSSMSLKNIRVEIEKLYLDTV